MLTVPQLQTCHLSGHDTGRGVGEKPGDPHPVGVGEPQLRTGVVDSARSAVPVSPPVRFCGPLAEPGVRVSTHRALHGLCCQAWLAIAQGLAILLPRCRYRAVGTRPSADNIRHRPLRPMSWRRISVQLQRCSRIHQRAILCHTNMAGDCMTLLATAYRK